MPSIRLVIADSNLQASEHLRGLLRNYPNLHLQAQCDDFHELRPWLQPQQTDLVLIDMHLPDLNVQGALLQDKPQYQPPLFIAMSKYEQDAFAAINNFAFAFLIKPVSRLALAKSLLNGHRLLWQSADQKYSAYPAKLMIQQGHGFLSLDEPGVLMIQAAGNYLCVHTLDGNHIVRETLKALLPKLPTCFVQVHRSTLINLHHLKQFSLQRGVYLMGLSDHSIVPVSRRYLPQIQPLLLGCFTHTQTN